MRLSFAFILIFSLYTSTIANAQSNISITYRWKKKTPVATTLMGIEVPRGYKRVELAPGSFGAWLRHMPIKPKGSKVHLFNGDLKSIQTVHAAVLDIDVGKRDRQQCADAIMRLRAEYLYSQGRAQNVCFQTVSRKHLCFRDYRSIGFRRYLSTVFAVANSRSLYRMLKKPSSNKQVHPGEVFIQAAGRGRYGHVVIVMDVAQNKRGEQIFLLAQSYMPAQQIHILKNPSSSYPSTLGPWYRFDSKSDLETPQWIFKTGSRRQF